MIGGRIVLLLGLFVAPALLLWLGHRLRDRSPRQRRAFWGGAIGHSAGMLITTAAALFPPIWWHQGGLLRDFAVHWSMLIGYVGGTVLAVLLGHSAPSKSDRRSGADRRTADRRTAPSVTAAENG